MSAAALASGGGVLRALWYVQVRSLLWRLRRLLTRPALLAAVVALVAGLVTLQVVALTAPTHPLEGRQPRLAVTAGLAAVLAVIIINAVRACPVRLRGADVAWLLPSPMGPRALVAWNLVSAVGRNGFIGVAAAAGAALRAGEITAVMWQPAVALAAIGLLIRSVSYVTHLITLRGVPKMVAGVVGVAVCLAAAVPPALQAAGFAWSPPVWLDGAGAPLRSVLSGLVAAVTAPDPAWWPALATAASLVVLLAVAAVVLGTGYQDQAARQTWELEAALAAFKKGGSTAAVLAESIAAQLPAGVRSFTGLERLQGEWALLWRALASLRRSWRSSLRPPLWFTVAAVVLAVLAPRYAAAPVVPPLLFSAMGFFSGFVEELEHLPVRVLPGVAWRKVLAVDVVPVGVITVSVWLILTPAVVIGVVPWMVLPAVPGVVAAAIAASSVAALSFPTPGVRVVISAGLVAVVYAVAAGMWFVAGGAAALGVGVLIAAACWALCAVLLDRRLPAR